MGAFTCDFGCIARACLFAFSRSSVSSRAFASSARARASDARLILLARIGTDSRDILICVCVCVGRSLPACCACCDSFVFGCRLRCCRCWDDLIEINVLRSLATRLDSLKIKISDARVPPFQYPFSSFLFSSFLIETMLKNLSRPSNVSYHQHETLQSRGDRSWTRSKQSLVQNTLLHFIVCLSGLFQKNERSHRHSQPLHQTLPDRLSIHQSGPTNTSSLTPVSRYTRDLELWTHSFQHAPRTQSDVREQRHGSTC
mmetsp:Transcript_39937/g.59247  ORF Transcript_39937/g.59247 Transcript_39937/m.59247 type:complete len:257 (-) Transcript_39937:783-1553(-)